MNLIEAVFWNVLYWALYLPIAVMLMISGAPNNLLIIALCGLIGSAILSGFLAFQDDLLFEFCTPVKETLAVRVRDEPEKPGSKIEESKAPEVNNENMEIKNPASKPVSLVEEVHTDETEEIEFPDGEEPEPRMRTDVSLDEFSANDDDSFSSGD